MIQAVRGGFSPPLEYRIRDAPSHGQIVLKAIPTPGKGGGWARLLSFSRTLMFGRFARRPHRKSEMLEFVFTVCSVRRQQQQQQQQRFVYRCASMCKIRLPYRWVQWFVMVPSHENIHTSQPYLYPMEILIPRTSGQFDGHFESKRQAPRVRQDAKSRKR